jgi:hypothetical protein
MSTAAADLQVKGLATVDPELVDVIRILRRLRAEDAFEAPADLADLHFAFDRGGGHGSFSGCWTDDPGRDAGRREVDASRTRR